MSTAECHEMLKLRLRAYHVAGVNIFDAERRADQSSGLAGSRTSASATATISRRSSPDPEFERFGIEPVHSRITGGWTTVIARKVTGPNGEFLGVVDAGIEPANFEKFFASRGARRRRRDLDAPSRRHAAGPLSACRRHDRAEFQDAARLQQKVFEAGPWHHRASPARSTARTGWHLLARAEPISDRDRRDHDGVGRAGRLAGAITVPDRRRRHFRAA